MNMTLRAGHNQGARKMAVGLGILLLGHSAAYSQAFPDQVKEFVPGVNAGHGAAYFPDNVLGPPNGTTNAQYPTFNEQDILTLGTGGHIIMEFNTNRIIDGPGPDFTVFENPVEPLSDPSQTFADTAVIAVSEDGEIWHTFPFDMVSSASGELKKKSNYVGFAGVQPSHSSPTNGISPFDPAVSGGDQFDLVNLSLSHIRFIKITDSGDARYKSQHDIHGDIVYDWGNLTDPNPTVPDSAPFAGFDLDAVAAIHTEPWSPPSSVSDWSTYD